MTAFYSNMIQNHLSLDTNASVKGANTQTNSIYRSVFKRVIDVLFVLAALPIVLPTVVVLASLAALDGSNPVYRQKRIGLGGRTFTMWKLRTMVPNAQGLLQDHLNKNEAALHRMGQNPKAERRSTDHRFG